jgi:putative endonuclease
MHNKEFGFYCEKIARWYLVQKGHQIIDTNYYCKGGELDVIARKYGLMYFVEVKAVYNGKTINPEELLTSKKVARIRKSIYYYLNENHVVNEDWRLMLLCIVVGDNKARIKVYINDESDLELA